MWYFLRLFWCLSDWTFVGDEEFVLFDRVGYRLVSIKACCQVDFILFLADLFYVLDCFYTLIPKHFFVVNAVQLAAIISEWIPHLIYHIHQWLDMAAEKSVVNTAMFMMCSSCSFCWCFSEDSNSPTKRATSGPATIHRCSNSAFCVSPMAPPSPLTWALFCSCAWSIAIVEKGFLVFGTVNLPLRNSCNTQGWRSPRLAMSRTCTGSHLA